MTSSYPQPVRPAATQLPCFIINLATAHERRAAMTERLTRQGLSPTWINAVDGRGAAGDAMLALADLDRAAQFHGSLKPTEIACVASHLQVYRRMVQERIAVAVVLEDDVILADDALALLAADTAGSIAAGLDEDEAAVVLLTHVKRGWRMGTRTVVGGRQLVPVAGPAWLTSGYVVTLAGAERLCRTHSPIWMAADNWELIRHDTGIHLLALSPPAAWEAPQAQVSSIASGIRRAIPARTLLQRIIASWRRTVIRPLFTRRLPEKD